MHSTALPGCRTDGDTGAASCGWRKKISNVPRIRNNWHAGACYQIKDLNSSAISELCLGSLPSAGSGGCLLWHFVLTSVCTAGPFGDECSGRCPQWVRWSLQSHCTNRAASALTWAVPPSQEYGIYYPNLWFIIPKVGWDEFWQVWNFGGGSFACKQFRIQNSLFCLALKTKHGVI